MAQRLACGCLNQEEWESRHTVPLPHSETQVERNQRAGMSVQAAHIRGDVLSGQRLAGECLNQEEWESRHTVPLPHSGRRSQWTADGG